MFLAFKRFSKVVLQYFFQTPPVLNLWALKKIIWFATNLTVLKILYKSPHRFLLFSTIFLREVCWHILGELYCDLIKAFDCVDHNILLERLSIMLKIIKLTQKGTKYMTTFL